MPIYDPKQKVNNLSEGINVTPALAQITNAPYVGAAFLKRDENGIFTVKETIRQSNGFYESGNERTLTGSYYKPPFVVRAITCNSSGTDESGQSIVPADGNMITIDLPQFTFLPIRLFGGVDRRIQVTRVYLNSIVDAMEIILWM